VVKDPSGRSRSLPVTVTHLYLGGHGGFDGSNGTDDRITVNVPSPTWDTPTAPKSWKLSYQHHYSLSFPELTGGDLV
jgi:hypothetical protein